MAVEGGPIAQAAVELIADASKFPDDVKQKLRQAAQDAGKDFDKALKDETRRTGRDVADKTAKDAGKGGDDAGKNWADHFRQAIANLVTKKALGIILAPLVGLAGILGFSTVAAGLAATAAALVQVTAAIAPAAGVVLALPSAFAIGAAAALTLSVAMIGVGDAFKAAVSGDERKFAESLKNLSPAAASVARELHTLRPALLDIKIATQDAFFGPLQGKLTQIAGVLAGPVQRGMLSVAGASGQVAAGIADIAKQSATVQLIDAAFATTTTSVNNLRPGLLAIVTGFRDLGLVALPIFQQMSGSVGGLATQFGQWLSRVAASGQAFAWIQNALAILRQLGDVLLQIGGIVAAVFRAAQATGGGLIGTFADLLRSVNAFLSSAEGQQALIGVFRALGEVGKALQPIVRELFVQLGQFAPIAAQIAIALGPGLTTIVQLLGVALKGLGPGLVAIAQGLSAGLANPVFQAGIAQLAAALGRLLVALGPLLPLIAQLAGILAQSLAQALDALVPALEPIIRALVDGLAPILPDIAESFAAIVSALAPLIPPLAQLVALAVRLAALGLNVVISGIAKAVEGLAAVIRPLAQLINAVFTAIGNIDLGAVFSGIGSTFSGLFDNIKSSAGGFSSWWTGLWNGLQSIAAPVVDWFNTQVTPRIAQMWDKIRQLGETFKQFWDKLWASDLGKGIRIFLAAAFAIISIGFNAIVIVIKETMAVIGSVLSGAWAAIKGIFSGAMIFIRAVLAGGWAAIKGVVIAAMQAIFGVVKGAWDAVSSVISGALTVIQGIIDVIIGIITLDWAQAWNGVKEIVSGVWQAISGIISGALTAIGAVVSGALDAIGAVWNGFWIALSGLLAGIWEAIKGIVSGALTAISGVISGTLRAIGGVWSAFWNGLIGFVNNAWSNITGGVRAGVEAVLSFIRDLPGRILSALGDLGRLLFEAGKRIIQGLLDGLKSAASSMFDFVSSIGPTIARLKGPLDKDKVLLIPAGKAIMQGLDRGLRSEFGRIERTLGQLTDMVPSLRVPVGSDPTRGAADVLSRMPKIAATTLLTAAGTRPAAGRTVTVNAPITVVTPAADPFIVARRASDEIAALAQA